MAVVVVSGESNVVLHLTTMDSWGHCVGDDPTNIFKEKALFCLTDHPGLCGSSCGGGG